MHSCTWRYFFFFFFALSCRISLGPKWSWSRARLNGLFSIRRSFTLPSYYITSSPCIVVTECHVIWVSEGNKRSSHSLSSAPSLTALLFLSIADLFPPTWPSLHLPSDICLSYSKSFSPSLSISVTFSLLLPSSFAFSFSCPLAASFPPSLTLSLLRCFSIFHTVERPKF